MCPAPDVETLSWLRVGGMMGVGFPGNHLCTDPPIPEENGQPLRSVGARPRLLLATSTGGIFIYKEKNKGFLNFKWEALWLKYEV